MTPTSPPRAAPPIWKMALVLSLNLFNGFVFYSLGLLAVAAQVQIYVPNDYEPINSATTIVGAAVQLSGFWVGSLADRFGRRPVLLSGSLIHVLSGIVFVVAVRLSGVGGLSVFMVGFVLAQLAISIEGVVLASLVSDYGELRPESTALISASYYFALNVGGVLGVSAAGPLLPVTESLHFWWFFLGMGALYVIAVLTVPRPMLAVRARRPPLAAQSSDLPLPAEPSGGLRAGLVTDSGSCGGGAAAPPSAREARQHAASACAPGAEADVFVLLEDAPAGGSVWRSLARWFCSEGHTAVRRVVIARTLFYFSSGIFQAAGLYYVETYITGKDHARGVAVLGESVVVTLVIAITCAAPAGRIADRLGPVPCVMVSSVCMGVLFGTFPYFKTELELLACSPLLGFGLLLFAVADLSLVIHALPDPNSRGRDLGIWNAFQYVGNALGGGFVGWIFWVEGGAEPAPHPSGSTGSAPPIYPVLDYRLAFWTGSAAIGVSCLFIWAAQVTLRRSAARARALSSSSSHVNVAVDDGPGPDAARALDYSPAAEQVAG